MKARLVGAMLLVVGLVTGACATAGDWTEWNQNKAHFASGEHAWFSLRNQTGTSHRVTRADVESARTQQWWGSPITVSSDQILQN
jgi:hypothetical protein